MFLIMVVTVISENYSHICHFLREQEAALDNSLLWSVAFEELYCIEAGFRYLLNYIQFSKVSFIRKRNILAETATTFDRLNTS